MGRDLDEKGDRLAKLAIAYTRSVPSADPSRSRGILGPYVIKSYGFGIADHTDYAEGVLITSGSEYVFSDDSRVGRICDDPEHVYGTLLPMLEAALVLDELARVGDEDSAS